MLEHLADMKIPAKSASSTLEDAYISIVRKKLQPIMEARAAEIAAQKAAEEEAAAKEARLLQRQQRLSDLLQRQGVRLSVLKKRRSAQKRRLLARKKRSAAALRKRRSVLEAEEAERNRVKDTAPKGCSFFQ